MKYEELHAVHSQAYGTAVPATWYSFAKDCGPYLLFICKRTAVLVQWYSFAKDCGPCLVPLVCKGTAVLVFHLLSQQNYDGLSPSKNMGNYPPGLVKMAVSQI